MLPALIGAGGALLAGGMTSALNMYESRKNRQFQERMSSTSHQREVQDLRKAGLNPILSSKLGGSSTSGGSQASAQMPDIVNSAIAMAKTGAEIDVLKEDARLKRANWALANGQAMAIAHLSDMRGYKAQQTILENKAKSSAYQLSEEKATSEYFDTPMGQFQPYIRFIERIMK